jgi:hypothetical protein
VEFKKYVGKNSNFEGKKTHIILAYIIHILPQGTHGFPKKISPFGRAVWPAIANI